MIGAADLTHRAGIPNLCSDDMKIELLLEADKILQLLCDAELTWVPGRRLAYHKARRPVSQKRVVHA